jgi:hypothetical protein
MAKALIRNKQLTQNTLASDRLENIPVQVLASRSGVDMTVSGVSELLVVPAGEIAIILGILFEASCNSS